MRRARSASARAACTQAPSRLHRGCTLKRHAARSPARTITARRDPGESAQKHCGLTASATRARGSGPHRMRGASEPKSKCVYRQHADACASPTASPALFSRAARAWHCAAACGSLAKCFKSLGPHKDDQRRLERVPASSRVPTHMPAGRCTQALTSTRSTHSAPHDTCHAAPRHFSAAHGPVACSASIMA